MSEANDQADVICELYNALAAVTEDATVDCMWCKSHEAVAKRALAHADKYLNQGHTEMSHPPVIAGQGTLVRALDIGEGMKVGNLVVRVLKRMGRKVQVAVTAPRDQDIQRLRNLW